MLMTKLLLAAIDFHRMEKWKSVPTSTVQLSAFFKTSSFLFNKTTEFGWTILLSWSFCWLLMVCSLIGQLTCGRCLLRRSLSCSGWAAERRAPCSSESFTPKRSPSRKSESRRRLISNTCASWSIPTSSASSRSQCMTTVAVNAQFWVQWTQLKNAVRVLGVFARRPRVTVSSWSIVLKGSCTRFSGPDVRSRHGCWWTGPQGSPAAWTTCTSTKSSTGTSSLQSKFCVMCALNF